MKSSVRRLEEAYQDRVDFHILNIDLISTNELMKTYEVSAIPNIVLLDAEGNLVEQFVGYMSEQQLLDAMERLLAVSG